jgi:hypothetical protein
MAHALMINPEHGLPVIVNMDSREFAELSCAGYYPEATGYKKQLELIEESLLSEMYGGLELNEMN